MSLKGYASDNFTWLCFLDIPRITLPANGNNIPRLHLRYAGNNYSLSFLSPFEKYLSVHYLPPFQLGFGLTLTSAQSYFFARISSTVRFASSDSVGSTASSIFAALLTGRFE